MSRAVVLSGDELEALKRLGYRIRLARLRRNLTMDEVAERAGTTRKSIGAPETGRETVGLALLVRVMAILGYRDRIAHLPESDPIGEDPESVHGRKRAGGVSGVADV
ncbi:helix-turn-helix transcriptional regulator [Azospirillum halopraeferens]|uniref:helix-turn-helix transcriptional regulator n=1 Tax=Azospirillum halopraeferens TaxID=34010 RepID=UPI000416D812|nr:helix-turn-helix transcriptional regulator [Azospirillum halopraeferens]